MNRLVDAISRRAVLTGCTALPVLAGLLDPTRRMAMAAPGPAPRRLLIWVHQEGAVRGSLVPTGSETSFTFPLPSRPIEPWKSRIIALDGVHNRAGEKNLKGDTHEKAYSGLLTGATVVERINPPLKSPNESLDQFLGPKIRGTSRLPSIELTVEPDAGASGPGIIYPAGGGTQMPMVGKASQAFDRMFGGLTGAGGVMPNEAELRKMRVFRGSVLDYVARDLTSWKARLGPQDGRKLQAHLDAIRDIEKQVAVVTPVSCSSGRKPTDFNVRDKSTIPAAHKLMMDMIVQAFACDVTRMITYSPTNGGQSGAPWLGEPADIHLISHGKYGDWTVSAPRWIRWVYEQHAYLMQRMSEVQEGNGTLLDHTLILSIHDFGDSASHNFKNLFMMLIGDAGGYLRTGRFVTFPGTGKAHNNVLVTVANAMGVDIKTFGEAGLCDGGPMPELRA